MQDTASLLCSSETAESVSEKKFTDLQPLTPGSMHLVLFDSGICID